ncbi:EpsG family protein [Pediococcus pentosaceus]|uniref:EpsG family protein n=1 Tax=Pediococcus pentosaceus TaxID=1255 RepID=UPI0019091A6A|nr:EpsG family protein [Pediococcus pentosaceus]MBF7124920.1 EpsG family protein [Pediococcus pentosaceus]WPK17125.1 EpsG family protein [Pediococcus pentosaceus]
MIYIYITLISSFIGIVFSVYNKKEITETGLVYYKSKTKLAIEMLMVSLPFFIISSFRYYVGTDYGHYSVDQIPSVLLGKQAKVETLYKLVIRLGHFLYPNNYQVIFILTTLLVVLFSFIYIFDRSYNVPASILLFTLTTFFNFSMNGMRQAVATSIFLFATKYIVEGKPLKYFIWILIAVGFHSSAIVFFPIYLIRKFHLSVIKLPIYILVAILTYSFKGLLFILMNKFGLYTEYLNSYYGTSNSRLLILNITMLLLIIIVLVTKGKDVLKNENLNTDTNILLYLILVQMFVNGIPNSNRMLLLLFPIAMTLIPNFINEFREILLKYISYIIIFTGFSYYFVYSILINNFQETLPYAWWMFWK